MKSILVWVGKKDWIFKQVQLSVSEDVRIVEVFGGSAAISFYLNHKNVWVNDINQDLMNFYNYVKQGEDFNLDIGIDKETFYEIRKLYNTDNLDGLSRAKLFWYLSKTCFKSMYRINRHGFYTTPYGYREHVDFSISEEQRNLIKSWKFTREPELHIQDFNENDLVIYDPPYQETFNGYDQVGFVDHAILFNKLKQNSFPVLMFNSKLPADLTNVHYVELKRTQRFRHNKLSEFLLYNEQAKKVLNFI